MTRRAKRLTSVEMGQVVHETYAVNYLMFNLGFEPDDVFVGVRKVGNWDPPGPCAVVQLRSQGKEFLYVVSPLVAQDAPRFERYWREFAKEQPKMSTEDKDAIIATTEAMGQFGVIAGKIAGKGFDIEAETLRKFTSSNWGTEASEP